MVLYGVDSSKSLATVKYNLWGDNDANGNKIPAGVNLLWHVLNLMELDPNLEVHWNDIGNGWILWFK